MEWKKVKDNFKVWFFEKFLILKFEDLFYYAFFIVGISMLNVGIRSFREWTNTPFEVYVIGFIMFLWIYVSWWFFNKIDGFVGWGALIALVGVIVNIESFFELSGLFIGFWIPFWLGTILIKQFKDKQLGGKTKCYSERRKKLRTRN